MAFLIEHRTSSGGKRQNESSLLNVVRFLMSSLFFVNLEWDKGKNCSSNSSSAFLFVSCF